MRGVKRLWWRLKAHYEANRAISMWEEMEIREGTVMTDEVEDELTSVAKHRQKEESDALSFVLPFLVGVIVGMLMILVIAAAAYAW